MMEYYYSMGQDCLHTGSIDDAVTYFRKAANLGAREAAEEICQIGEKLEKGEGVSKDEVKIAGRSRPVTIFPVPTFFWAECT